MAIGPVPSPNGLKVDNSAAVDNTDTLKILGLTLDCKLLLLFAAHVSEKVKK